MKRLRALLSGARGCSHRTSPPRTAPASCSRTTERCIRPPGGCQTLDKRTRCRPRLTSLISQWKLPYVFQYLYTPRLVERALSTISHGPTSASLTKRGVDMVHGRDESNAGQRAEVRQRSLCASTSQHCAW